jgi:hypothetical protein
VHPVNLRNQPMLDKLFGWNKKKEEQRPAVSFGRYSDNNKSVEKVNRWTEADQLFKEKKYNECLDAFFDYLRDDAINNVITERRGAELHFRIYQGSKIVRGKCDGARMEAEVTLARMPQPSVPVMRRLLEQNFNLYYSRYALDGDRLCMRFQSDMATANPNKMYYGLKELATKADKQDDLLVQDFTQLQTADTEHMLQLTEQEKEIKYHYFLQFIKNTLDLIETLDKDKISGGISYLLLALGYRIDFLIAPEGKLLLELEKIVGAYFTKDEKPVQEKNQQMIEEYKKMLGKTKEDVFPFLFRSKSTFSIVAPQQHKTIADSIYNAAQNMLWYRDNKYPEIARQILEYGLSYCQYSYSLPRPLTELFSLFMQVNYPAYFAALGFTIKYYDETAMKFDKDEIEEEIKTIMDKWKAKYPNLVFKTQNLKYTNPVDFNHSFTAEIQNLNFDAGR